MDKIEFDKIDSTIIKMYLNDARTSLTEVAEVCGVSPNAIFKRVEGLRSRKIITGSTTLFNPKFLEERFAATVEITAEHSESKNVLDFLSGHPRVLMLFESIGRCNIFALIGANCVGELDSIKEEIRALHGVNRMVFSVRVDEFEFFYQNLELMENGGTSDG
jgi:DNA-binding Lrp family transcriptional regulator